MQVYWSHTYAYGDANGIAWAGGGSGGNGDAINGGGYITVHAPGPNVSTEENGASAQPHFPLVASMPVWDTNYSAWNWQLGFAVPEGMQVESHTWVATA
jgi:hypothetical protein